MAQFTVLRKCSAGVSRPSRGDRKGTNLIHHTLRGITFEADGASESVPTIVMLKSQLWKSDRRMIGEKKVTSSLPASVVNLSSHAEHLKRCFVS